MLAELFRPLPIGNIRGDSAERVAAALGVAQGKLDHNARVGAVVMQRRFFESHRGVGFEHLPVIRAKCGGLRWRKDFLVGFANEILLRQTGHRFKLAIGLEVASIQIFEEDQGRTVVHDRAKAIFAVTERVIDPSGFGDVTKDHHSAFDQSHVIP
mgnify:CR=1 FL=1